MQHVQNQTINYKSKSGSSYIFNEIGVYRISNHWGRASNCRWRLNSKNATVNQQYVVGFAKWIDFYPNDETSKLFFIKVDSTAKEVAFYHKNSPAYDGRAVVRNANQTSKVIQNIKMILNETSWCKYLKFNNFDVLQTEIINELIYSEKNFLEIKRQYL